MTHQLKSWTAAQTTAGQKMSDIWQKHFQAERKDSIPGVDAFSETARIQEVQDKRELELLRMDNVVGVAPSLKMKGGKPTGEWSLTVLVESKVPKTQVAKAWIELYRY